MIHYKEFYMDDQLCQLWLGLKPCNYKTANFFYAFPYPQIMKKEMNKEYSWDTHSLKFLRAFSKEGPIDLFRILYPDVETEGKLIYSPSRTIMPTKSKIEFNPYMRELRINNNNFREIQGSGEGCHNELNDKTYCPKCKSVLIDAFKQNCQVIVEKVKERCNDYTIEQVKTFIEEDELKLKQYEDEHPNELHFRRCYMGRYDMSHPNDHNKIGEFIRADIAYFYSYWTEHDEFDLYKWMAKNKEDGSSIPWVEYR
jgi:hypothetical protein